MTDFKVGDRVEFDAKDLVQVGTIVERAGITFEQLQFVIVDTEDGSTYAIHPDSLRFVQEK